MESYGERQVSATLEGIREDHRQRYLWALSHMETPACALDAGCGVGYGSNLLSQKAEQVIGLDISQEAIDYANRFWKNEKIRFFAADLHFLRFDEPPPKFDAAVCFECIEHMAIPELFLCRLRSYLAPGARVFLSVPHESVQPFYLHRNPYHFMHYTQSDLDSLLRRTGFRLIELCSQDDTEVRPDVTGRFLVACCECGELEPEVDIKTLEAELPNRLQTHFSRMGNELAMGLGIRMERDRLKKGAEEYSRRLAEVDKDRLIAKSKLEGAESLRGEVNRLRQDLEGFKKQQQEFAKSIQRCEAAQRQGEAVQRQHEKKFRDIWQHPAFRRLARFNKIGLKLLGVFGFELPHIRPRKNSKRDDASLPAQKTSVSPTIDGKLPVRQESLAFSNEVYVRGFCAAANVYGAVGRAVSGKRIVIDVTRVFNEHLTGVGHYCDQLTRAFLRRAPHEIALYSGRPLPQWILEYQGYPQFYHCPPKRVVNDFNKVDKVPHISELTGRADAFLDISATYAPIVRANGRLGCIYDLAPVSCPETVPESVAQRCIANAKYMMQSCSKLVAISEFTKQDYIKHTGCPADRIVVIPVGLGPAFRREITDLDRARVRARFKLEDGYMLCVGTLQPRKNLIRLLKAYGQLKKEMPEVPRLLLTGSDQWADMPEFREQFEKMHAEHSVEWLGYIDRQDMPALYNMSEIFIYPSYFEGYGMPVAEAMASGAAVICAEGTSLPEVAGDAAKYCDPFSVDAIAAAMKTVLGNPDHAADLRQRALKHAETFPAWDDVADRYLELMETLLK